MGQANHNKILKQAAEDQVISYQQCLTLMNAFEDASKNTKVFSFSHILFYFGGFLAITAVTIFLSLSFANFNEVGLLISSSLVFGGTLWLTRHYIHKDLRIPAGIVATFGVCLVPFMVYCIYVMTGFVTDDYQGYHKLIRWQWVIMELLSLIVAAVMLYVYRLPFMMFAVAVTLWYLSMDLGLLLLEAEYWALSVRRTISIGFGVVMILSAVCIDGRSLRENDYAFWFYIFGVSSLWLSTTSAVDKAWMPMTLYFLLNLMFLVLGAFLKRKVFVVYATIGSLYYLGYLSNMIFNDTLVFSLALILTGMLMIKLGILWQAHHAAIETRIRAKLPSSVTHYLDAISR